MVLSSMITEPDVRYIATCDVQARMRTSVKAMADEHYGNKCCKLPK